ncbi:MAG: RluA family pseudouridine synthase [Planctomycetes bacterium]|nr:RluA family pseudouridine synthase [Planctomycetota bacterium]
MDPDDSILRGIRIVHRTARFVVVDKPTGVLSVPGIGPEKADCVVTRIHRAFYREDADDTPRGPGQLVVHRLDMDTSGLMVVALDADAQRELSLQFEERKPEKRYVALLAGLVHQDEGTIDLPMRLDIDNRPFQIVDHERGRPAVTHYRVLARETDRTRIEFRPVTGRTHQLRVHARYGLGHAILGDPLYSSDSPISGRLMLHAAYLSFLEPGGAARLEFRSEPPF